MSFFAVLSSFLIYFGIILYVLIVISDIFYIPVIYTPLVTLIIMLLQLIFFPRIILSVIKKAISEEIPKEAEIATENGIRVLTLKTPMPIIFSLQGLFFKNTIVISDTICSSFDKNHIEWIIKRELSRAISMVNIIFMSSGLIPFILLNLSMLIKKLGENNRAFGGSESILSFGGMIYLVAKGLYLLLYLPSRELSKFFDNKTGDIPKGLFEKLCSSRKNDDKNMISFWKSISYLCLTSPQDKTDEKIDYLKTVWQSRYLLFRPLLPPSLRQNEIIKRSDKSDIGLMQIEASAFTMLIISFVLISIGINAGIPIILSSILFLYLHLTSRPLLGKRVSSSEGMNISPIRGKKFAGSGKLSYDTINGYLLNGLRLYFYELSPVILPKKAETEDIQVAGWIKKSDKTFVEVSTLYINGKQTYKSDKQFWYMVMDFILLICGIIMTLQ